MAKSYYQKYKQPRVHVQVWTEANGPVPKGFVVDHINGDIHDNRLENLRLATVAQNIRNSKRRSDNKSGLKGLSWDKSRGCFRGTVTTDGRSHSFRSKDLLEVCCWLHTTRKEAHGEFGRRG